MVRLDGQTREAESDWPSVMATNPSKPVVDLGSDLAKPTVWPHALGANAAGTSSTQLSADRLVAPQYLRPAGGDALQALLAFSALHQQVRQRRALSARLMGFEVIINPREFESQEQFVLDEVLQMVAERAIAITGADGLGIALAENNEIVLRASAGAIKPDVGARIQRDSAFTGACFRTAQVIRCDDTETDDRVNLDACRKLGARSMVAVPLCGRRRVIGILEAFSDEPFGFNDTDVTSLELLAELILAALKPEDEDRFALSAEVAEAELCPEAVVVHEPEFPQQGSAVPPIAPQIRKAVEPQGKVPEAAYAASEPLSTKAPSELPITETTLAVVEPETRENLAILTAVADELPAQPVENRHPGAVLILVLIVVCALLGGGIWWKLKNAQLGEVMIKPEPKMAAPHAASKPPAPTPATSVPAPSTGLDGQVNANTPSAATADRDADSDQTASNPSRLARITGIRHWSSADSSTVVLDLEDQVQYEAHRLANPDRIYFDLHDTALAPEIDGKTIDINDPLLSRVRIAQPTPGLTRVVLETKGNSNYSVSLEPNPYRLVVQVRMPGADPKAQINLFPGMETERQKMAIVIPPPAKEDLQLRAHVPKMRIVVDAGHGGWDLGTVGRHGLLEKDLVLEIAQRLGKLLQSRLGANVILTRSDDTYIPLDERAGMANQSQADLFVSVHANYSDLPSARGVETYYTNFFSSPTAKDIETRDNTAGAKAAVANVALSAADLHERIEQSRRLAASVQRSLYGTLSADNPGLRDRGVKEASYVVLTETAMPGILAEVSFVSSPTDEQKLRSDGYREQIAEALYRGIARYAANTHPVKLASAGK
ncbi:MAG TPA: N-acetylmuramoyl-L-alanine amidase [Candidatus Sulfotelmatobacter sp.]|jgi:N-acetylmuramoyl-L-alanine amidase/putative methionine-R-sulfoxide reductase with GAF domain